MTTHPPVPDILWPALAVGRGATVLGLAFQLEQSQWWSPEKLRAYQFEQLTALLRHARATVPFYRKRLADTGLTDEQALTPEGWLRIPLLTRQEVRQHQADLTAIHLPNGHSPTHRRRTSGSTGEPLEVSRTAVDILMWEALTIRDDLWHQREYSGRFVMIRSGRYERDPLAVSDFPTWGLQTPLPFYKNGPLTVFYHLMPIPRQADILEARSPQYLAIHPSNARALCRYARRRPLRLPDLKAVVTSGEPLPADVRAACRETWGVPAQDMYCCEELGYLAMQCPHGEHYHVPCETVLLEILDVQGRPCDPGQIGRVVVTPLHSFAMPLIRYALGDYAEVGRPCPCGRGLPVLQRILGRQRNQMILPDGRRTWPDISALWAAIRDVEQIQLVHNSPDQVEVRYVRDQSLSAAEEQASEERIHQALGYPFRLTFARQDSIARQPNGKYETFVQQWASPPRR